MIIIYHVWYSEQKNSMNEEDNDDLEMHCGLGKNSQLSVCVSLIICHILHYASSEISWVLEFLKLNCFIVKLMMDIQ